MRIAGFEPLEPYRSLKAKWRCRHGTCGREVTPTLGQILRGKGGCKFCARVFVDPVEAVAVMRMAGYEPLEPYRKSGHRWRCLCKTCGKETSPTYDEARSGSRCKYCSRRATHPDDALRLMRSGGFEPLEPYPGAMEPWMCRHLECGEIRFPRYAHIQQGRRGCRLCSSRLAAESLRLDHDTAAKVMQDAGLQPLEPYPGTNNAPWRCRHIECGDEVSPSYASIQQGQGGCKPCHQRRLARRYKMPEAEAAAIMRSAGFEPDIPYPGRNHAAWPATHMACGRKVAPALSNVKNGSGCAYCSEKRIDETEARELMRRAGLSPLSGFPGSKAPWPCIHVECGRAVTPTYASIAQGGSGCPYCSGARIHPDDASRLFEERGFSPLEPFPGSNKPWRAIHECGRPVEPMYSNVAAGGGCKYCASTAFDYEAPGIVYLLRNDSYRALKIGITTRTARTDRIQEHARSGWILLNKWETPTGLEAEILETAILDWWRKVLRAPVALTADQMPAGGFTETSFMVHVSADQTIQRLAALLDEVYHS